MSALGMNALGVVRTAFEFKDIFDKTGGSQGPYRCPFCEVPYVDKCITTQCKKAAHFSLPKDKVHRSGCDGEGLTEATPNVEEIDEPKRTVIGDVDFPEALVEARRERARFNPLATDVVPTTDQVRVRRTGVDTRGLMSSRYTSSLLRTFVVAYRTLCERAGEYASTYGEQGSREYRSAFSDVLDSRGLQLYGERLTYRTAFQGSQVWPSQHGRIFRGFGAVERRGAELVIRDDNLWPEAFQSPSRLELFVVAHSALAEDAPRLHAETFAQLEAAAQARRKVKWNAYGYVEHTEHGEFVLRLQTLDHLYLG